MWGKTRESVAHSQLGSSQGRMIIKVRCAENNRRRRFYGAAKNSAVEKKGPGEQNGGESLPKSKMKKEPMENNWGEIKSVDKNWIERD